MYGQGPYSVVPFKLFIGHAEAKMKFWKFWTTLELSTVRTMARTSSLSLVVMDKPGRADIS